MAAGLWLQSLGGGRQAFGLPKADHEQFTTKKSGDFHGI